MFGIGFAIDRVRNGPDTCRRAIAAFAAGLPPVNFDKLRVVHAVTERTSDTDQVSLVAIAGELDAVGEALAQVSEKFPRRLPATVANVPRWDQLCVSVDCRPGPNVASFALKKLLNRGISLLGINERPNFIDLDALAGQIYERLVLIIEASLTGIDHQLGHGVLADPGEPGHGADRGSLAKQMEDAGAGFPIEFVHRATI